MPEAILECLDPVTRRYRQRRWWRSVTVIALVAIAIGSFALWRQPRSATPVAADAEPVPGVAGEGLPAAEAMDFLLAPGAESALLLAVGTLACLFAAWCFVRFSFHDRRLIATRVEARFPSLQQRLLTALSQLPAEDPPGSAERLGYLQRRVIAEATDHARQHRWAETVPTRSLWVSRLSGVAATAALLLLLGVLVTAEPPTGTTGQAARVAEPGSMTVEPGDAIVERGKGLVITARFTGPVPEGADLVCVDRAGRERRIAMARNLADPVLGALLSSIDQPMTYQVVTAVGISPPFEIDVFEYPDLVRADADLVYPEYTGMDAARVEDTVRVSAVEGTRLTWTLHLNKPVAAAELIDDDGGRLAASSSGERPEVVSVVVPMERSRRWRLSLVDDEGRENKVAPELFARVIPNEPPQVKLLTAGDARVSPLQEYPIAAEVRDDFGLVSVGIRYRFADQPPVDRVLAESLSGGRQERVEHLFDFESLGALPDQLLAYHLWAEDIGPDGMPRRTEGDLYFAEVRPFEEIFREGQPPAGGDGGPQQQQDGSGGNGDRAEELAELQKQVITATWNVRRRESGDQLTPPFVDDVSLIADSQREAMGQLGELRQRLRDEDSQGYAEAAMTAMGSAAAALDRAAGEPSAEPLEEALADAQAAYQGLLRLRAREFEVTRQQQPGGQGGGSASQQQRQQQIQELELSRDENRYESQQQAGLSPQEDEQRETRQVLNRLRELAQRQEDLNEQIAQLQSALQQAESPEEQQELERRLKRLRDQQQNLLREVDELSERMQTPENRQRMTEAADQLAETREQVRQAGEALERNDAAEALTAGTRAERQLAEMRDEFRREAAGEFSDAMREMRREGRDLADRQQGLAEQLESSDRSDEPGLRGAVDREALREQLGQQRERLEQLLERMRETVEEAELTEPLLAQSLYESIRRAQQQQLPEGLEAAEELWRRGFDADARRFEAEAREGIESLRDGLDRAAESLLGDETRALERALSELETLSRDLDNELRRRGQAEGSEPESPTDPAEAATARAADGDPATAEAATGGDAPAQDSPGGDAPGQGARGERPPDGRMPGESPPGDGAPGETAPGETAPGEGAAGDGAAGDGAPGEGAPGEGAAGEGAAGEGAPGESGDGEGTAGQAPRGQGSENGGSPTAPSGGGSARGGGPGGRESDGWGGGIPGEYREGPVGERSVADDPRRDPLTGDGFREWSDRLRDVEEIVDDPELRSRAARVRDRAREVRRELRRHAREPQWPLVEELIAEPLRTLRRDVAEELMRRSAERNAIVPIDRDPVPDRFSEAVRLYYERLGSGR